MKSKTGSMTRQRFPWFRSFTLGTAVVFALTSCGTFYHFQPLASPDPSDMKFALKIAGSGLDIGVRPYNTAEKVHALFGHKGLWKEHVVPVLLVIQQQRNATATVNPHSLFLFINHQRFPALSPSETFDISWQEKVPYQTTEKALYYTGLILFTIVTLGLGSMIWVLPSPFVQPSPSQDPFGRDLAYKAFPLDGKILSHGRIGGLLYFNTPYDEQMLAKAKLTFQIMEKGNRKGSRMHVINAEIPLHATGKSKVNPLFEMLRGFF